MSLLVFDAALLQQVLSLLLAHLQTGMYLLLTYTISASPTVAAFHLALTIVQCSALHDMLSKLQQLLLSIWCEIKQKCDSVALTHSLETDINLLLGNQ